MKKHNSTIIVIVLLIGIFAGVLFWQVYKPIDLTKVSLMKCNKYESLKIKALKLRKYNSDQSSPLIYSALKDICFYNVYSATVRGIYDVLSEEPILQIYAPNYVKDMCELKNDFSDENYCDLEYAKINAIHEKKMNELGIFYNDSKEKRESKSK